MVKQQHPPPPPSQKRKFIEKPNILTHFSLPPNTTEQEDITHASQRAINLIWERTQATIALLVVSCAIFDGVFSQVYASLHPTISVPQGPNILSNAFFGIIGFYFGRTNHSAVGGIGFKSKDKEYTGR